MSQRNLTLVNCAFTCCASLLSKRNSKTAEWEQQNIKHSFSPVGFPLFGSDGHTGLVVARGKDRVGNHQQ